MSSRGFIGRSKALRAAPTPKIDHRCACGAKATVFWRGGKACEECFDAETLRQIGPHGRAPQPKGKEGGG